MKKLDSKQNIHLKRKAMHIMVGLILAMALYSFDEDLVKPFIYGICILGVILESLRLNNSSFNSWVLTKVSWFARAEEESRLSGLSFYFIGASVSLLIVPAKTLSILVLILAVGDPLAAYIGKRWGKKKFSENKSWLGSFSLMVVSSLILFCANTLGIPLPYFLAIIITLAEAFPLFDDNFSILFFGSLGVYLLSL